MAKPKITVGILAGGSGTRFWPAGRRSMPKQLLALDPGDPRSLLALTLDRVARLTDEPARLIAPKALAPSFRKALPPAAVDAALWEPRPRNTAAAVALIAHAAALDAPDQPVLVVPADHMIHPVSKYRAVLAAMASRARRTDAILTLGLKPTRPATGYGYLEVGAETESRKAGTFHAVKRYVEKPTLRVARRYVRGGRHLWNGGTFAFRPSVFLAELETHLPEVAGPLAGAFSMYGRRGFPGALRRAYDQVPSISVDYGVMERAGQVETLAVELGWDDLGSWDAIARHAPVDADGNAARGDVTLENTSGCVVEALDGHVALLGVEDLIVVRTGDSVLVAKKGAGEDVRRIVDRLQAEAREDLLR